MNPDLISCTCMEHDAVIRELKKEVERLRSEADNADRDFWKSRIEYKKLLERIQSGQRAWGVYEEILADDNGATVEPLMEVVFDEPDQDGLCHDLKAIPVMVIPWPDDLK
jgi:hypothetical protein